MHGTGGDGRRMSVWHGGSSITGVITREKQVIQYAEALVG
jgi:hypothetical protein